mgnify:CR=1 FL=1
MPKKVIILNDFSGGLNTDKSSRALEDNELAECTNFNVSSKGKIRASRIFKQTSLYGQNSNGSEADPGYGLFTFSNDRLISVPGTTNIGEFIVAWGTNLELDILEVTATGTDTTAWQNDAVSATNIGIRTAFYAAEGDLFVGGTTSATPPVLQGPSSLVYHKQDQIPSANGGAVAVATWVSSTQDNKPIPTVGSAGTGMQILQTDGIGTELDVNMLGQNMMNWIIFPTGSGLWSNDIDGDYYEYAGSWLYKNEAESDLVLLQDGSDNGSVGAYGSKMYGAADFGIADPTSLQVQAYINHNVPFTSTNFNTIYGGRLYARLKSDNGDFYLLAEVNFEKGIQGSGETDWTPWETASSDFEHDTVGDSCTTGLISAPPALLTYKILNGFSPGETGDRLVKFKTGLVANSRAYIGNVEINGRPYGDRILKSPIYQYDVFTEDSYLDVAINDGDQITALAAHGDRILQFKNSALYIINVSKELEFLEDEQQGAGVSFQAAVTTTPFGVVWVNTNGCYLYDGSDIKQLQLGKISASDWTTNITSLATIGYDSEHQQVIVLWNSNAVSTAYVFDAETGGWHKVSDMVDPTKHTTNMVNARGDKLLVGGGATVNDINFLADRTAAATGFSLKTKVFDFGNPESKKNLLEVAVVYKGYGNAASAVKVNTTADDGTLTTTTLGNLTIADGEITTKEFDTSATPDLQGNKTYQIELSGTFAHNFEAYSITLTYRDLGVH